MALDTPHGRQGVSLAWEEAEVFRQPTFCMMGNVLFLEGNPHLKYTLVYKLRLAVFLL